MKHDYIDQNQIIERYVMEQLQPDETEDFERHFLHCERCRDEITLSEKLQLGFREAVGIEELSQAEPSKINLWRRYLNIATQPKWATAATILITAMISSNLVSLRMVSNAQDARDNLILQVAQSSLPQSNIPIVSLSPARSGRSIDNQFPDNLLTLNSEPKWIVLAMLLPPEAGFPPYQVALRDAKRKTLWLNDNLLLNNNDEIVVGIHSSLLTKGLYSLQVEGVKADDTWEEVSYYFFQVDSE